MLFERIDSMGETGKILDLIANRQNALGENLANVDTPGYTSKDVKFAQYLNSSGGSALEVKLNEKLGQSETFNEDTGEPVRAANELVELQKNSLLYSVATRRMSNIITEMKTVINVGK
jgi:flagellar basal-body rod protein FlgB